MAALSLALLALGLAKPAPCGQFEQQKMLPGLSKPLVSTGRYGLQDGALVWHSLSPFESTLIIKGSGLYQQLPGQEPVQLASADNPLVASLASLLPAVIQGDQAALEAHFVVSQESAGLRLVPKDTLLKAALEAIEVEGQPPALIRMLEPQGGQTLIHLTPGTCQ